MNRHGLLPKLEKISKTIDSINEWIGKIIAWLVLGMVLLVGYDVTMRYFFRSGSVALQELEWHIFSIIFLIGAAYTLKYDEHVRLDVFYQSRFMNNYRRAWINLLGNLLFLIPFCLLIILSSWPFVSQSFIHAEASPDPGGLDYRWLIKAAIPAGFILLLFQGIAEFLRNLTQIIKNKA